LSFVRTNAPPFRLHVLELDDAPDAALDPMCMPFLNWFVLTVSAIPAAELS